MAKTLGLRAKAGIRIQLISDLHAEFGPHAEPSPAEVATGADAVVLAGDTARAPEAVAVAARLFPGVPLVMVHGNHEAYSTGMTINEGLAVMRREAAARSEADGRPIHVLEDEAAVIMLRGVPVRFLGCTLWTDFALFGDPVRDRMVVERGLNDFRLIRGRATSPLGMFLGDGDTTFKTAEWLDRHEASKEFLRAGLAEPHDGPTVVVTHHLPSMRSVGQRFKKSRLSAGFASRLDDLVVMGATLWVHGHTHDSRLWRAPGGTLVACNPAGYARQTYMNNVIRENKDFNPKLVFDIRRGGTDRAWRAGRERMPDS